MPQQVTKASQIFSFILRSNYWYTISNTKEETSYYMTCKNISNLHLIPRPVLREKAWKCDHRNGLKIMNKSNTLRYCRKDIHYQVLYPQDIPVICYENRNLINVEGHQDNVYAVYVSIPGVNWFPNTLSLSVWPFLPCNN